jgi:hypothetical protein
VKLAVKSLMQLAAIDTPSGGTATSRYAADEIATYGRGFRAKGWQETYFELSKFRWTLFFCQEG